MTHPRVEQLIATLGLESHPEGGYFREVYRSAAGIDPGDGRGTRATVTTIYYLLAAGQCSRWHDVRSDEVWHLYEGGPLDLFVAPPDLATIDRRRLDRAGSGGGPVAVVPPRWWQAARPAGPYALVGCTVAPGFDYADFRFLRDVPSALDALSKHPADIVELA
ncbi:MAG: cupin domain-containing protein [Vicinamibacterales bacterium]